MRYAIMSDYHGANLEALEVPEFLEEMKVDTIISLGDFDQTRTMRQYMALRGKYQVIEVPGNHDYAILLGQTIYSGTMLAQGKTCEALNRELYADRDALAYMKRLVDYQAPGRIGNAIRLFLDEDSLGRAYPTIVVHGALAGNMQSFPDCPESLRDVWARLDSDDDHAANFKAMDGMGARVMLRGHDHEPAYVYMDADGIHRERAHDGTAHRLLPGKMHVINPGAMYNGLLAMIDTDLGKEGFWEGERVPVLTHHCL